MIEQIDPVPIPPSPLLAIIRDVQLKNHGASSASNNKATRSAPDPWDDRMAQQMQQQQSMEYSNHDRSDFSRSGIEAIKRNSWFTVGSADLYHAEALLHVTPQLRFLSQASTDMQGISHATNNLFSLLTPDTNDPSTEDYTYTLRREESNRQAAAELASLLWILAHEMSIEDYGKLENEVFAQVFSLIHDTPIDNKVAGLTALDALLNVPSADDERKGIKFANTLSNALRSTQGDFLALRLCAQALGNLAATSVDFAESEITRALEWLRMERSDRRLAASLALRELAIHLPTTFHSKTSTPSLSHGGGSNEFLDHIYKAIRDPQPIVRVCATDALSQCLKILVERQHPSLTDLLVRVHFELMEGLDLDTRNIKNRQALALAEASQHGSLLVVSSMLVYTREFIIPCYEEICRGVLKLTSHPKALIRLEVIRLLPRLAKRDPHVFGRRYLDESILFLLETAASPPNPRISIDLQPMGFVSLGELVRAMVDTQSGRVVGGLNEPTLKIIEDPDGGEIVEMHQSGFIYEKMADIFDLVGQGLNTESGHNPEVDATALHCAAGLVEALGSLAVSYLPSLINDMFHSGLSKDLITCLHAISEFAPDQRIEIENRILRQVSSTLARVDSGYHPMESFLAFKRSLVSDEDESTGVAINEDDDIETVSSLVLALNTLASFGNKQGTVSASNGAMIPLLPFLKDVVARYLTHRNADVRRAAATTCSSILIPNGASTPSLSWNYSNAVVEDVLKLMIRSCVTDPDPEVRLAIVQALDSRYDSYLRQSHHLQQLFMLLRDESLVTRSKGLSLLGRLASLNPGSILPNMRCFLNELIVRLQCSDGSNELENAVRLLVVFLQSRPLQILVHPVLSTLVVSLPKDMSASPRLASASLEAFGELAQASKEALEPWVHEIISHVLVVMDDRSSSSKLRTSLRTLGQISGATGYVIKPYLDYPQLLPHAIDILPASKLAPWSLRREVIRTLGIIGALDPDRYKNVSPNSRPEGTGRNGYFEMDNAHVTTKPLIPSTGSSSPMTGIDFIVDLEEEEDAPAHRFMYSQYSMVAQPESTTPRPNRLSPIHEDFYPMVAIQSLIGILKNPALSVHHSMVVQAIMFIFKAMALGAVQFLPRVVPHLVSIVRTTSAYHLRDFVLTQLADLSGIVREHLRPFFSEIFNLIDELWTGRHISAIYTLVSTLGLGVPQDFRRFSPIVIRQLLRTFEDAQGSGWLSEPNHIEMLRLSLKMVKNLQALFNEYFHILSPSLLKLASFFTQLAHSREVGLGDSNFVELSVSIFRTIAALLCNLGLTQQPRRPQILGYPGIQLVRTSDGPFVSRVVQVLVRILGETPPRNHAITLSIVECFSISMIAVGASGWQQYNLGVRNALLEWQTRFGDSSSQGENMPDSCLDMYDECLDDVTKNQQKRLLLQYTSIDSSISDFGNDYLVDQNHTNLQGLSGTNRQKMNQSKLQKAWDASHKTSKDDWEEWMRRFSIQLLKEAPSAALRATANLAQAYPPLSRELFCAAFSCCWEDLNDLYRADLVRSLQAAFIADLSPEILQTLLNLAEFMEHNLGGGLPIETPILAELALKCRAYAKALHYKEREYELSGSADCVEELININGKLDLPEAARGIVTACSPTEQMMGTNESTDGTEHPLTYGEMHYSVMYGTRGSLKLHDDPELNTSSRGELWLTKLGDWSEALELHEERLRIDPSDLEAAVGCMRCYSANGDWGEVLDLANDYPVLTSKLNEHADNNTATPHRKALRMCAKAAWRLGQWGELEDFASRLTGANEAESKQSSTSGRDGAIELVDYESAFYNGVILIHRKEWTKAARAIDSARQAMDGRLTALMAESYSRSYPTMVQAQTLSEMEEIIELQKVESSTERIRNVVGKGAGKSRLLGVWKSRLAGCRSDVDVFDSVLAVRSLVLRPDDDIESVIKLSELARQNKRYKFGERVLLEPLKQLGANLNGETFGFGFPEQVSVPTTLHQSESSLPGYIENIVAGDASRLALSYGQIQEEMTQNILQVAGGPDKLTVQYKLYLELLKHMFYTNKKSDTVLRLKYLCDTVEMVSCCDGILDDSLRVKCWLEISEWQLLQSASPGETTLPERVQAEVLTSLRRAIGPENCGYKAWHSWALMNFRLSMQISDQITASTGPTPAVNQKKLRMHLVASVRGFVNAICLGTKAWSATVQQDLLNLLTCLFKHGKVSQVSSELHESMGRINLDAWLGVLPQLVARIHIMDSSIRSILHPLLTKLGEKHPQALIYSLSVLLKDPGVKRKKSAEVLMKSLRHHSSALVDEALLVSAELIRVAITWLESWHEGLEAASQHYAGNGAIPEMLDILLPLHEEVEQEPKTQKEVEFVKDIGQHLKVAHGFLQEYIRIAGRDGKLADSTNREQAEGAVDKAWDVYYPVFRLINKQLPQLNTKFDLAKCSSALYAARNLELSVPGTYRVDGSYVKIEKFIPNVEIISSKQRPRKVRIRGSDGNDYVFLLKGHEDLRQDERVMQLFGLVNALLARNSQTTKHDFQIQRYPVTPLSNNCGVVGWVPNCDTLHTLMKDYRHSKKILLSLEHREMHNIAPDYESLTVMQKVEVFTEALKKTAGNGRDLKDLMWQKSTNSEEWLERRTKFTRSLAVMSMVGYILGLGDRHPSNLMLDNISGRVLHIDFGDCFEVAMHREKYPEKIPFRLTRMLVSAMEVSGVEGSYRCTCEKTMSVLRESRDSLVSMLEAFVYDPLITWHYYSAEAGKDTIDSAAGPTVVEDPMGNDSRDPTDTHAGEEPAPSFNFVDPISEGAEEEGEGEIIQALLRSPRPTEVQSVRRGAASLKMHAEIQRMAANLSSRIKSISGNVGSERSSMAHSRVERSMRQRDIHSKLDAEGGAALEEALNKRALKLIHRVEDKLEGTDFPEFQGEKLDVPDQVQRLIVQATSVENLCQAFVGWCSFW